jgi:hypothetical protein
LYLPLLWIRNFIYGSESGSGFSKVTDPELGLTFKNYEINPFLVVFINVYIHGPGSGFKTSKYRSGSGKMFMILTDPDPQHWLLILKNLFTKIVSIRINFVRTFFAFGLISHSEEGAFEQKSFGHKAHSDVFLSEIGRSEIGRSEIGRSEI